MLLKVLVFNLISLLCFQGLALSSMSTREVPRYVDFLEPGEIAKQPEEAVRLWEQAVAAKGGREHLHSVRNMVISSRGEYMTSSFKKNKIRTEELLVFPNKYWSWDDLRPDVFGLTVEMYNYDTNMKYIISDGEPHHPPEPIKERQRNKSLRNAQLSFLLETKWMKPTLVKANTGRVGLRPVDIVQTTVEGERVDFAFDRKTHLPVRVSYYDVVRGKTYIMALALSDYIEISGIKVPQTSKVDEGDKYKYGEGVKYKASYQFNVEYDPEIFVKPPPLEAGPEAWRRKNK
jgi:hypothetical protein